MTVTVYCHGHPVTISVRNPVCPECGKRLRVVW